MSIKKNKKTGYYTIDLYLRSEGRFRIVGYSDKRATERLEDRIKELDSCVAAGIQPDRDLIQWLESASESLKGKLIKHGLVSEGSVQRTKSIYKHLDDYLNYQQGQAAKGVLGKDRIQKFQQRITNIIINCKFQQLSDINANPFDKWLTQQYSNKRFSAKTCNHYLQEFKQFCRWLVENNRMTEKPIATLKPITIDSGNVTFERRALTQEEITRLINTTISANKRNNLSGEQRCLIYQIALLTGLRYSEIKSLQRESFDFTNNTVTIKDINAKNSKTDTLPLKPELAKHLQTYFAQNPALPKANAFENMQAKGIYMLKKDLKEAGIDYITQDGRADFHSLRHTYGTQLAKSGVLPQLAQKLMRHSSIDLTTNLYTHLLISDKQEAISKLPDIIIADDQRAATGTDNATIPLTGKSDQILTKSTFFGNNRMDRHGQFEGIESSGLINVTAYKNRGNTINTSINPSINTANSTDTNWRRDGDSNPG